MGKDYHDGQRSSPMPQQAGGEVGIGAEAVDGPTACCMFNQAIAGQTPVLRIKYQIP